MEKNNDWSSRKKRKETRSDEFQFEMCDQSSKEILPVTFPERAMENDWSIVQLSNDTEDQSLHSKKEKYQE